MKIPLKLRMVWLLPLALALLMLVFGFGNQREIERLRAEREALAVDAATAGIPVRPDGRVVRVRTRERVDHRSEGRRIAAELAARAGTVVDGAAGVELADDVLAMNAEQLREAIGYLLQTEGKEQSHRKAQLIYLFGRLAEDHPWETLSLLADLRTDQPDMFDSSHIIPLVTKAAEQISVSEPDAVWDWVQNEKILINERHVQPFRRAVLRGMGRVDPAAALRLAGREGIDSLIWGDQTADEKHASLAALRAWTEDPEVVRKGIVALAFATPADGHVRFDVVTEWVDRAGLINDHSSFLGSGTNLSDRFDPSETSSWLDWLVARLPPDAAEPRIQQMREDHRTRAEVEKWLERRASR